MPGRRVPLGNAPFCSSQHYDASINCVGHAENWDELAIRGDISKRIAH